MTVSAENNVALQQALEYAVECHAGMFDRMGSPFVLHAIRVAQKQDSYDGQIVAVLHDTIEKGRATADSIAGRFGADIAEAVQLLTHDKSIPYMDYIRTLAGNRLAAMVKLADIEDNSDVRRMVSQECRSNRSSRPYLLEQLKRIAMRKLSEQYVVGRVRRNFALHRNMGRTGRSN